MRFVCRLLIFKTWLDIYIYTWVYPLAVMYPSTSPVPIILILDFFLFLSIFWPTSISSVNCFLCTGRVCLHRSLLCYCLLFIQRFCPTGEDCLYFEPIDTPKKKRTVCKTESPSSITIQTVRLYCHVLHSMCVFCEYNSLLNGQFSA